MHIRKLTIENFKSFDKAEFHFDPVLNVLTGVNNSGKTTVLEAVALWAECFGKRLWRVGKDDAKKGLKRGQYRLDYQYYYDALSSVRCPSHADVFRDLSTETPIALEAVLEHEGDELAVGFSIKHARGGNYAIELLDGQSFPVVKLNEFFVAFPDPIYVVYASPVAALLSGEDFQTLPKIRHEVRTRQSMHVLRNRLYELRKDAVGLANFLRDLDQILQKQATFSFHNDETTDVENQVLLAIGPNDVAKDISLVGSGTLQIIELLLALYAPERRKSGPRGPDLNIVLLDEPDSYIHRDIQRRLIDKLTEFRDRTQVFVTSHNESLIRSTPSQHLFHLEPGSSKIYEPIYKTKADSQKKGLQPSPQLKILKSLGYETSIDFLNALEAERLVLVEGEDDARFIQAIVEGQVTPHVPFAAMYWSFEGIDTMFQRVGIYREIFEQFKNDRTLWEKAVLAFDRDSMTIRQRDGVVQALSKRLGIPVYASTSYTMEATVLSEPDKLQQLLGRLLEKEEGQTPDAAKLGVLMGAGIDELVEKLRERVKDDLFLKELFHRMKNRRGQLEALGLKKSILPEDASIQLDYAAFANLALAERKVHLLANKDDVLALVEGVHRGLGLTFQPDRLFERLVDTATRSTLSTWFDEWKELRAAIKK
jgi:hypothetical protein